MRISREPIQSMVLDIVFCQRPARGHSHIKENYKKGERQDPAAANIDHVHDTTS